METVDMSNKVSEVDTTKVVQLVQGVYNVINNRCPEGHGLAIPKAEVAKLLSLGDNAEDLISGLIKAHMIPGWTIRTGRDGGICRVGEEALRPAAGEKFSQEWLDQLNKILTQTVPKDGFTPRNEIAKLLAKETGEDLLACPKRITDAMNANKCPNFASRRGSGIHWVSSDDTEVSADAADMVSDSDLVSEMSSSDGNIFEPGDKEVLNTETSLIEPETSTSAEEPKKKKNKKEKKAA